MQIASFLYDHMRRWIVSLNRISDKTLWISEVWKDSRRIILRDCPSKGKKMKREPSKTEVQWKKLTIGTELSEYDAEHRAEHD